MFYCQLEIWPMSRGTTSWVEFTFKVGFGNKTRWIWRRRKREFLEFQDLNKIFGAQEFKLFKQAVWGHHVQLKIPTVCFLLVLGLLGRLKEELGGVFGCELGLGTGAAGTMNPPSFVGWGRIRRSFPTCTATDTIWENIRSYWWLHIKICRDTFLN